MDDSREAQVPSENRNHFKNSSKFKSQAQSGKINHRVQSTMHPEINKKSTVPGTKFLTGEYLMKIARTRKLTKMKKASRKTVQSHKKHLGKKLGRSFEKFVKSPMKSGNGEMPFRSISKQSGENSDTEMEANRHFYADLYESLSDLKQQKKGLEILRKGDFIGSLNCIFPNLDLKPLPNNPKVPCQDPKFSLFSDPPEALPRIFDLANKYRKDLLCTQKTDAVPFVRERRRSQAALQKYIFSELERKSPDELIAKDKKDIKRSKSLDAFAFKFMRFAVDQNGAKDDKVEITFNRTNEEEFPEFVPNSNKTPRSVDILDESIFREKHELYKMNVLKNYFTERYMEISDLDRVSEDLFGCTHKIKAKGNASGTSQPNTGDTQYTKFTYSSIVKSKSSEKMKNVSSLRIVRPTKPMDSEENFTVLKNNHSKRAIQTGTPLAANVSNENDPPKGEKQLDELENRIIVDIEALLSENNSIHEHTKLSSGRTFEPTAHTTFSKQTMHPEAVTNYSTNIYQQANEAYLRYLTAWQNRLLFLYKQDKPDISRLVSPNQVQEPQFGSKCYQPFYQYLQAPQRQQNSMFNYIQQHQRNLAIASRHQLGNMAVGNQWTPVGVHPLAKDFLNHLGGYNAPLHNFTYPQQQFKPDIPFIPISPFGIPNQSTYHNVQTDIQRKQNQSQGNQNFTTIKSPSDLYRVTSIADLEEQAIEQRNPSEEDIDSHYDSLKRQAEEQYICDDTDDIKVDNVVVSRERLE